MGVGFYQVMNTKVLRSDGSMSWFQYDPGCLATKCKLESKLQPNLVCSILLLVVAETVINNLRCKAVVTRS